MEHTYLQAIPALATWKMLSDTIDTLHTMSTEKLFERLSIMVEKPALCEMFVFEMPHVPFEELNVLNQKKKEFTSWVLGQFFYLSTLPNIQRLQKSFVTAQNRILHQMHDFIYYDLISEYVKVLEQLNQYAQNNYTGDVRLKVFLHEVPEDLAETLKLKALTIEVKNKSDCVNMQGVVLQIVGHSAVQMLDMFYITEMTIALMENLLLVLKYSNLNLKIAVLQIYVNCLESQQKHPKQIEDVKMICLIFETLFTTKCMLGCEKFDKLAVDLFSTMKDDLKCQKLYEYILLNDCVPQKFKEIAIKHVKSIKSFKSNKNLNFLPCFKEAIIKEIHQTNTTNVYKDIYNKILNILVYQNNENAVCKLDNDLNTLENFMGIVLCARFETQFILLDEKEFVQKFIAYVAAHMRYCHCDLHFERFINIMCLVVATGNSQYAKTVFQWFVYLLNKNAPTIHEAGDIGEGIQMILAHLKSKKFARERIFEQWCYYMHMLIISNEENYEEYEKYFLKVAKAIMEEPRSACQEVLLKYLIVLMSKTQKIEEFERYLLTPAMISVQIDVRIMFAKVLPSLFIILCTKFERCVYFDNKILCVKVQETNTAKKIKIEGEYLHEQRDRLFEDLQSQRIIIILKAALRLLVENENNNQCCIQVIKALPAISKYVPMFSQVVISKWMKPIETKDVHVKNALVDVISDVLSAPLHIPQIQDGDKYAQFLDRFSNSYWTPLINLYAYSHICTCKTRLLILLIESPTWNTNALLNVLKYTFYFIIMVTSNVCHKALTTLFWFRKRKDTTTSRLYTKYRPELCKIIVNLCAVNQACAGMKLSASLESFAGELCYDDVKHMIIEETRYLLPFFVSLCFKRPAVEQLIEEIASYNEMEVKELFSDKYGYIYVYLTMYENHEECERCLRFVEQKSGERGITLRKNNFMVILNELLLNFYEKREQVLQRLSILASEESGNSQTSVPEYIRPRFLGVLQYFDLKLLSTYHNKKNILQSLAAIFKYLGPKYITPVRFKIIAMLRTVLAQTEGKFPELNCIVWEGFIHSCDLEILSPQLATICVSIYPLIKKNEPKINDVLKYLIITNEKILEDNIVDLFFLLELDLNVLIAQKLRSHLEKVQALSFKEHLKVFMRYLSYETIEVQWHALKYIKQLLNKNRSELEAMILGFNGIDACIVELIDYLLQGCREYDSKIRSACGDCIGELGAIEPSHLPPPRSIQEEEDFNFSITDKNFILNSLNEFARAMQVEANCQKMDTFALAIQETLRTYKISPDERGGLWGSLTDVQKELMLPFVSSKYCNVSNRQVVHKGPIYGSNLGSNFKRWLDNWTFKLISTLTSEKKQLFCAYVPSMKQDIKTLMYFLPHIFLNSLIEGQLQAQKESYDEFMAVIERNNEDVKGEDIKKRRIIRMDTAFVEKDKKSHQSYKREDYLKVVFVLFDFLERWMREWMWERYTGQENHEYQSIKNFISKFCKYQLAKSNFQFGGYPRALMYLEDHIMADRENQDECLTLLSEIYCRLNEPDGVAGVTALRKSEASLEQRILDHEAAGQIPLTAACYERLPLSLPQLHGLVKSQLEMDHANTSLYLAKGVWEGQPADYLSDWMLEAQTEPLWRLGRYDELDQLLQKRELQESTNWGVHTGRALIHFRNGDRNAFKQQLETLKMIQVDSLGASSLEEGTYQHGYYYIARIHAINELEQIENGVHELLLRPQSEQSAHAIINQMKDEWELRLKCVQQSVKVIEPILCLRRAALDIAKQKAEKNVKPAVGALHSLLGDTWLKSAVIAMNSEFHKQAYSYILKAEEFAPPRLFVEKAKWFWLCNEHEQALTTLERHLRVLLPTGKVPANFSQSIRKICAEAKLHVASYNNALSNVDVDVNIQHYKESIEMFRECEKSLVYLAQYYDRVLLSMSEEDRDVKGSEIQIHMINYFGKSLQYGTEYIYQSMPRLLSIWFDYGTRLLDVKSPAVKEERQQNLLRMTKLIDNCLDRLPPYIFLTAFSQIISRICHSQKEIYKELNQIVAKLILNYPQQTLWMMISVIKSSYELRSKRCREILSDPRLKTPVMVKFLNDFIQLAEKLIDLTNKEIGGSRCSVNAILRALPRLLSQKDFSEIMIPTHKFRKLILPNPENINMSYNAFPNHYVHIVGIEDEITILPSLQRPRKITLRGSDGKLYIQMLKPKDDLRKDFRLMEFNDIVNQLLSKEAESRERRLNIRLYSVAPLNEECGMIEWVPNLVGLRPTLMTIYKQRGSGMRARELKECCPKLSDPLEKKRSIYTKILLVKHPPVLGDWFRRTFPDAHGWLTARTAYTRTTAVMSMVGHILGLGDRHGENILLDSTCGDAVHVDFNCLFNKGEQFEWPERVPFRLTPNMVAAMGPLGVEGMFRKSCACTLHVLRTHANTLMSIVTPFVYDPLVSWPKRVANVNTGNEERTNPLSMEHIKVIQRRLQGQVKTTKRMSYSISLSVEGQTNKLIAEAMSIDNLCQMYIGWGPYL
ncbi:LOW QUALITY PROTEIN: serine/threonine-protein kinase ATR [Atheta coriaria]|uniref:LOW QUALITY PROTEIN: serine/threonine-protein kinase ATR n=1 Tax=Dalotia coriaria TaxID=877792 RepID=UPI0031F425E4